MEFHMEIDILRYFIVAFFCCQRREANKVFLCSVRLSPHNELSLSLSHSLFVSLSLSRQPIAALGTQHSPPIRPGRPLSDQSQALRETRQQLFRSHSVQGVIWHWRHRRVCLPQSQGCHVMERIIKLPIIIILMENFSSVVTNYVDIPS